MKNIKSALIIFSLSILCSASCKKMVNSVANDPNTATDVPLKLLLPSAELSVGLTHSMELAWYSSVFMQTQGGVDRQMAAADKYNILDADMNKPWNDAYANALTDLHLIIAKAEKDSSYTYSGIAKILTAMTLGTLSDCWGDIPYSQAFQGSADLTPAYDKQEDVYKTIQRLLTEAINELNRSAKNAPAGDDLIYGGSVALWISTAHTLKARYYNHLSKIDPDGSARNALAALDAGGYSDNSEDAVFAFGNTQNEANPWYQFVNQRGDIRMGYFMVHFMDSIADPRLAVYATKNANNSYSGSPAGNPDIASSPMGALFASIDSKVPLTTYVEAKFIEAEAALRINDNARAASAYNAAVTASLAFAGVSNAAFITLFGSETAATITLSKIMNQKYIALFSQIESWTDYRRTGFPDLKPATGNSLGTIPRRLLYPLTEKSNNAQNVPQATIQTSRVWWDK